MLWQMAKFHFLWLSSIPVSVCRCACVYQVFTGSSVDGHLGYLHILAIVNSAAVNTGVCVSFRITVLFFFFLRYIPRSRIPGSYGTSLTPVFKTED